MGANINVVLFQSHFFAKGSWKMLYQIVFTYCVVWVWEQGSSCPSCPCPVLHTGIGAWDICPSSWHRGCLFFLMATAIMCCVQCSKRCGGRRQDNTDALNLVPRDDRVGLLPIHRHSQSLPLPCCVRSVSCSLLLHLLKWFGRDENWVLRVRRHWEQPTPSISIFAGYMPLSRVLCEAFT